MNKNAEKAYSIVFTYAEHFDNLISLAKEKGKGDHLSIPYFHLLDSDIRKLYGREPLSNNIFKENFLQEIVLVDFDLNLRSLLNGGDMQSRYLGKLIVWRFGLLTAFISMCTDQISQNKLFVLAQVANALSGGSKISWVSAPEVEPIVQILSRCEGLCEEKMIAFCRKILSNPEIAGEHLTHTAPYEHPIDEKIIGALNNPAVNSTLNALVEASAATNFGMLIASSIPVSEKNFPEINTIVKHCVDILNIHAPHVVISTEGGMNAYTFGSDREPYIVLTHLLVKNMTPDMLCFVIGHECGHIAMGHVIYHIAAELLLSAGTSLTQGIPRACIMATQVSKLSLSAWNRRSEITADRAGLLCCGDLDTAIRALVQLQSGSLEAGKIDIADYLFQSEEYLKGSSLRRMSELFASHPLIPKRIRALNLFAQSCCYNVMEGNCVESSMIDNCTLEEEVENIIAVM